MACSFRSSPSITPPGKRKSQSITGDTVDLRSQSAIIHSWSEGKDTEGHIVRCIAKATKNIKDTHPNDNHVAQLLELDEEITAIEAEIARIRKLKQDLKESSLPGHSSSESFSSLADLEFSVDDDEQSVDFPDLDLDVEVDVVDVDVDGEWSGDDSPSIFSSGKDESSVACESRKRPRNSQHSLPKPKINISPKSEESKKRRSRSRPLMSKVELVETITHLLPSEKLSGVIDIVSESSVPLVTTGNDDIEFDISSIDEKTFYKLNDFVQECLATENDGDEEEKRPKKKTRTKRKRALAPVPRKETRGRVSMDIVAIFKEEEVVRVNKSTEDELVEIC